MRISKIKRWFIQQFSQIGITNLKYHQSLDSNPFFYIKHYRKGMFL